MSGEPKRARGEAKAAGLPRYFTGEPCAQGHVGGRWTNSGVCIECKRIKQRERYRADPGLKDRVVAWQKTNPERVKEIARGVYFRKHGRIPPDLIEPPGWATLENVR